MTTSIKDIDIFALCKEHARIQGELPLAQLTRLQDDLTQTNGTLSHSVTGAQDPEKRLFLHLTISGILPMNCQRCAEDLAHEISVNNTLELVHTEAELDDEEEELNAIMSGNAGVEKIVGSQNFDLMALLEEEIILSLPIVVAHEVCSETLPTAIGEKVSPFDALLALKNK